MWERLDRGQKLVAAILGLGTLGGSISGGIMLMSRNAAASVVAPIEKRVSTLEEQHKNEIDWRWYLIQRLDHISVAVGAPTQPPPESLIVPPKEPR